MKKDDLVLTRFIKEAYEENGFVSAVVFGRQGIGKTTYALIVAYQIYQDWDTVFDHLFFKPDEVVDYLINNKSRAKLIILDDAGTWLNTMSWWTMDKIVFSELFDVLRTRTAGIIFTTPNVNNLISRIRDQIMYRIRIEKVGKDDWRRAIIYSAGLSPKMQLFVRKIGYDYFKCKVEDEVYKRYLQIREYYVEEKIKELESAVYQKKETDFP